eukprot:scaffold47_cov258-Pinguiococcus_pyrenoidosus.AAC.25
MHAEPCHERPWLLGGRAVCLRQRHASAARTRDRVDVGVRREALEDVLRAQLLLAAWARLDRRIDLQVGVQQIENLFPKQHLRLHLIPHGPATVFESIRSAFLDVLQRLRPGEREVRRLW